MSGLMIVDDQEIVRQGIRKMLGQINLEISPVYEASNGIEALSTACKHEPDIILVDIMMPGMDGLEFVNQLRKNGSNSRIVIISAYNEFNYAKKAIDLKVDSYILKPVTRKELYKVLSSLIQNIRNNEGTAKPGEQQKYEDMLLYGYLKNEDIFINIDSLYMKNGISRLTLDYFQIILLRAKRADISSMNGLKTHIDGIIRNKDIPFVSFYPRESLLIYILNFSETADNKAPAGLASDGESIIQAYIGTSMVMKGRVSLPELFRQAEAALKECQFKGLNLVQYDNIKKGSTVLIGIGDYNRVIDVIRNGTKKELNSALDEIFYEISKSDFNFEDMKTSLVNLVNFIYLNLKQSHSDLLISEDFKTAISFNIDFLSLKLAVKQEIERILDYICEANSLDVINPVIRSVLSYISKNFKKDISLSLIANEYNINYNYLSTLFTKIVGIPFSEYILKIRLEEANKFLSSGNYKVYEVAEMVGFKDPKYFCKAFKRQFNKTPAEVLPKNISVKT